MEIRVPCTCGQAYAFEVEPVNGLMPCPVACPACGIDGTQSANEVIRQAIGAPATSAAPMRMPTPPPAASLRINRSAPEASAAPPPPPPNIAATAPPRFTPAAPQRKTEEVTNNMVMGILGALGGAAVGSVVLFGLSMAIGIKFPMFGTITGALTGFGARWMYKGTDSALGGIAAVIALVAVTGTLYVMFGEFAIFNIVSILVSASIAWRIAS